MNEQQEIDNYKNMITMIIKKCHDLHGGNNLCTDCENALFRVRQDIISNAGIELKIKSNEYSIERQEMGTVRIDQNTMDAFDLNPNDISEIRTRSGGHTVSIVRPLPGKGEKIIHTSFMTHLNLSLSVPRNQREKRRVSKDVFMMRKIETIPVNKLIVQPQPQQY